MNIYFINESIDKAIKNYIESKNNPNGILFNSFLVVVIRTLNVIYDELDVVGPYLSKNPEIFKQNLIKYGYSVDQFNLFCNEMHNFMIKENNKILPNDSFINLEKMLIDMFLYKKQNFDVSEEEELEFKNLLYSPRSKNEVMISFNFLNSKDEKEIINYFNLKYKSIVKVEDVEPKKLLSPEAYRIINKNYTDVALLSSKDVELINSEVYNKLEVNKNAVNFEFLYDKALQKFYLDNSKPITSGNGYVDILLILGVIVTIVMIVIIIMAFI